MSRHSRSIEFMEGWYSRRLIPDPHAMDEKGLHAADQAHHVCWLRASDPFGDPAFSGHSLQQLHNGYMEDVAQSRREDGFQELQVPAA